MRMDPNGQIDPLSRTVVHLTMQFNETNLATGTGILVKVPRSVSGADSRYNNVFFLVTALHNFTGREVSGEAKHSQGGVPNNVLIEGFHVNERFPLYSGNNDPNTDLPCFWIHSDGVKVDVSMMPLGQYWRHAPTLDDSFLDPRRNESAMPLFVSQTCHIIGFPEGLIDRPQKDLVLPVWKTGHIASEPACPFGQQPVILVDATTRPGMSGAPVIVRREEHARRRLVGIYSGRTSEFSDIARVFTPNVILEMLRTGPMTEPIFW